ncbi:hypothetical protein [Streptomyces sp. NPDC093568]|uniref:hypothetical protein n=1 Tax=Streptomyces sp. NPDC093568 TaxID=3366041 RepID=UPI00381F0DC4
MCRRRVKAGASGRLCRLTSAAHAHGSGSPALAWGDLHQHAGEGLTALLGPASEPLRALAAGRADLAEHLLVPVRQLPGIQLRLETCWLGIDGTGSLRLAAHTLTLADHLGIPAAPTNAVRYADPSSTVGTCRRRHVGRETRPDTLPG